MKQRRYYRVESLFSTLPQIGKFIDTGESSDLKRIERFRDLENLFEKIYNCSKDYNLPVSTILELITTINTPRFDYILSQIFVDKNELNYIVSISNERKFDVFSEGRYLFDFYLKIAQQKIFDEKGLDLPDRFKSKYFFESIKDCLYYMREKGVGKIIEVEFSEKQKYIRVDNKLLNEFDNNLTSIDLLKQAENFLLGIETTNPLFEIVFCGRYKVVSHIGWSRLLTNQL